MIEWLTTAPNPRVTSYTADDGQRGWSTHAVEIAGKKTTLEDVRTFRAICGLRPRHGWGMDLFIKKKCVKCARKLGLTPVIIGGQIHDWKEPT